MTNRRPLEGYRVIDFCWVMAGPITGHFFADMGAEVIKVESRKRVDISRRGIPIVTPDYNPQDPYDEWERVPLFHNLNRGKKSIAVDIGLPEGKEVIRRLVKVSDVVLENFTPHVMPGLGLNYPRLRSIKPDLVMVSLAALGQTGPLRDAPGYAPSVASLSGIQSLVGYPSEPPMGILGLSFADPNAGLLGFVAALIALRHRNRTGQGQHIDISEMEAIDVFLAEPILDLVMNHRSPVPKGNFHPRMAPYNNYPCLGEDQWIAIAIDTEEEWQALCQVAKEPWCQDSRFATRQGRLQHRGDLDRLLAGWTRQYTKEEITERLQGVGVAATPVLEIQGQWKDPQYKARQVYVEQEHPKVGREVIYGVSWKFSETPGAIRGPAPLLGQHTREVLGDLLGLSAEAVERLRQEEVLV